ncbi:MAG: CHAD domain-containing protein [Candidatus Xenobia bacterium]
MLVPINNRRLVPTLRTEVDPGPLLMDAVRRRWKGFEEQLVRARQQTHADETHDLRVALRRLQASLDLIQQAAPTPYRPGLRRRLKKVLRRLGPLRDAQVQEHLVGQLQEQFPELAGFHRSRTRVARDLRRDVRQRLKDLPMRRLRQKREQLLAELGLYLTRTPQDSLRKRIMEALDRRFTAVLAARRTVDASNLATIHTMRVAFKKFRYMVEILQPAMIGVGNAQLASMQAFQGMMGDVHDLDVLVATLSCFRRRSPHGSRLWRAQEELSHRLLLATDAFIGASDEVFSFWSLVR